MWFNEGLTLMKLPQLFFLSFAFSAGCSTMSREQVFSDEKRLLRESTGYEIEYAPQDQEVAKRTEEYLKDGITAEEAVCIALLNNQELQASYEKLGIARGELIDAGLLRNPIFEAEIHFEG